MPLLLLPTIRGPIGMLQPMNMRYQKSTGIFISRFNIEINISMQHCINAIVISSNGVLITGIQVPGFIFYAQFHSSLAVTKFGYTLMND